MVQLTECCRCGFCCRNPCAYGKSGEDGSCMHLTPVNGVQFTCGIYDEIVAKTPTWDIYPAFGAGCSSTLFNEMRDNVLRSLRDGSTDRTARK